MVTTHQAAGKGFGERAGAMLIIGIYKEAAASTHVSVRKNCG